MIDSVLLYMLIVAGVVVPLAGFVALMAHRQRLEEEAEDAERASGTPAE